MKMQQPYLAKSCVDFFEKAAGLAFALHVAKCLAVSYVITVSGLLDPLCGTREPCRSRIL